MPEITTTTATETAPLWFAGFDDATKGHITAKGYDKLDPTAAFGEAFKAYKEAESKLGIPADRLLRLPEPADAEGWKAVHQKLGVPPDAAGYDFATVKKADGSALDDKYAAFLRETAHKLNISKDAAPVWAAAQVKYEEDARAADASAKAISVAAAKEVLDREWGGNKDTYNFIAKRAAELIGLGPEFLNAAAESASYGKIMNDLVKLGQKMGEAPLLGGGGGNPGGGPLMTPDQAKARLADFTEGRDRAWTTRYMAGEKAAIDEFVNLTKIIHGQRVSP